MLYAYVNSGAKPMALKICPDCGHRVSERAQFCIQCGCPAVNFSDSTLPLQDPAKANSEAEHAGMKQLPFFPVPTHKFVVLSVCTLGIYQSYWSYQNWKRIKASSNDRLSPFWRGLLSLIWSYRLFSRIQKKANSTGVATNWNPDFLAFMFLVLTWSGWLPYPWSLFSLLNVTPFLPVQIAAQRVNDRYSSECSEGRDESYGFADIAIILVCWALLVLIFLTNSVLQAD